MQHCSTHLLAASLGPVSLKTLLADVAIAGGTAGDQGRQWRESSQTSGIRTYTSIRGSELMILYCRGRNCTFSP